jgi:hypothetical protein
MSVAFSLADFIALENPQMAVSQLADPSSGQSATNNGDKWGGSVN